MPPLQRVVTPCRKLAAALFIAIAAHAQEPPPVNPAQDAVMERCFERLDALRGAWTAEWETQEAMAVVETTSSARGAALQMTQSEDPIVRQRALEALNLHRDAVNLRDYLWALGDPDPAIRESAVQAVLRILAAPLLEQILDVLVENAESDVRALDAALPELAPAMGDEFLRLFRDRSLPVAIRRAASYSLGRMRVMRATSELAEAAWKEESSLATSCAMALYALRDTRAVSAWIGLCKHHDYAIRWLAVQALAELGGREAYAALEALAQGGEDQDAKLVPAAIGALATWPLVDCVPALIAVMKTNPGFRQTAAGYLSQRTGEALGDRAEVWEDWYINGPAPPPEESAAPPPDDGTSDLLNHAQFVPPELQGRAF